MSRAESSFVPRSTEPAHTPEVGRPACGVARGRARAAGGGAAALLEFAGGSVSNGDVALLLLAAVLVVAVGGRVGPVVVAAGSATLAYDYFHTKPYHSLSIANGNDVVATVALGLVALGIGLAATHGARAAEEVVLVVGVAVFSQAVPEPARVVLDHRGLDAALAALVLVTALTIPLSRMLELRQRSRRLLAALAASTVVLPVLSWAVARARHHGELAARRHRRRRGPRGDRVRRRDVPRRR